MTFKDAVNGALKSATGYRLTRTSPEEQRAEKRAAAQRARERTAQRLRKEAAAREAKDWAAADAIRDTLAGLGLEITDTPTGPRWSLEKK